VTRNRRTDQGPGDIVEEGGDHEDQDEEHESAPPIVGENDRHPIGNAACLEMARQERKADEKQKQIGEQDPFMGEMDEETGETGTLVETVPKQLLDDEGAKTGERYRERVAVEDRDASERDAEQKKIEHDGRILSAELRCEGHPPIRPVNCTSGKWRQPKEGRPQAKAGLTASWLTGGAGKFVAGEGPGVQPRFANGTARLLWLDHKGGKLCLFGS
jgi:hypothetical protein